MQFRKRQRNSLILDITPLIDVVFLLLIFFMVTTTFTWQTELMINLPEAVGVPQENKATSVRVTVDKDGNYFVNDQPLVNNQAQTLSNALKEASDNNLQTPLVIHGDANAPHHAVVTVMDVAGQLGFSRIDITTKKPNEK